MSHVSKIAMSMAGCLIAVSACERSGTSPSGASRPQVTSTWPSRPQPTYRNMSSSDPSEVRIPEQILVDPTSEIDSITGCGIAGACRPPVDEAPGGGTGAGGGNEDRGDEETRDEDPRGDESQDVDPENEETINEDSENARGGG